jgi:hypothetical protein
MSCQTLVHELNCDQSKTMKELHDIATRHASGEEAVRAIFIQGDRKMVPGGSRGGGGHHPKPTTKALGKAPKVAKRGKRGDPNGW